ncbi:phosphotransacetylase [Scopulibacillus darangshiensis]|uniref:Phosphate acetyltransferase n=1 Tax=Scopulibacillus darangshiensis TaxID=442528 RepID=A0A4R2NI81_9BACL|nr:phosphate acetyltransferase [Scopulibacillus darangshiensis]TCP20952.1 phosphotransacetylase [Scopulibacillus darangshiensis]
MFEDMKATVGQAKPKIVFPEGGDVRIVEAVVRLADENILHPILVGERESFAGKVLELEKAGRLEIRHPKQDANFLELVKALVERRKGKTTEEQATEWLHDANYYGTILVYTGQADGLVSGAAHSTADTVRPALQIIKTKPGVKRSSGAFIMVKEDERLVFADCAINITPDSRDLAEIAVESAATAKAFGIDPKVAMLSFSTKGSAEAPEADKVVEATKLVRESAPDLTVDGECQFDAAYVPEVAAKKAPGSPLDGKANVFVFPSLEAGNIGYKMVQRLGGYDAVGPILQGLNKPVNDLSRGCSVDDVYKLALITALQSLVD